ncbi:MAG: M14 family zinc carboxypeptidase, partial [Acidobacteriota bacterium]
MKPLRPRARGAILVAVVFLFAGSAASPAQQAGSTSRQKIDEAYSKRIREVTTDPRVITELVDHVPASDTVPSPLKFFNHIVGEPGYLTYYKDIVRYLEAVDKASDRVTLWKIGKSDEGRDMIALAIADEVTIKSLEKYKQITAQLTDPRKISDAQAKQLIATGKPIYYATGSIHSPETGSPEMLMELTYRLAVEESPFIQAIRNNIIVMITPATEVDGRDKQVDNYWYQKKTGKTPAPLMYWGNYVAHDNNRDAMGASLNLTRNMLGAFLAWHPTVWHDLHESVSYLYTSTGTGPYNSSLDAIQIDEWWLLSKYETSEMAKRGVPGVWTYGFYDGWVPNYLFFIANMHNSIGRFYETQAYRGENYDLSLPATTTSREWFRPNPPLSSIKWGPRNNVNIQQSALLLAMSYVAKNREQFLENYYVKNKRAVEKGKTTAPYAWVIPADQRRRVEAAELVNLLRLQGAEVHAATAAYTGGGVTVKPGDYIVRMDQPYRTLLDMLMDVQNYPAANPRPYDDTGWSFPLLRNVKALRATDKAILDQPMTLIAQDVSVPGTIAGTGDTLIVEHNTDNTLVTFRFTNKDVKMLAAEEDF